MATMTYLELVNGVMRRLREPTVSTVASSDYSALIGDFVNDAKVSVENSWDWTALRSTISISTLSNVKNYALTGTGWQGKQLNVINDTSNWVMEYRTADWFDEKYYIDGQTSGAPRYYTFGETDANGDQTIDLYPKPDGVYNIRFDAVVRNARLTSDSDVLEIPYMPVLHLALALAARERGETGGTSTQEYFQIAKGLLGDAIALDAALHPEDTIFYTP
jgi:hypothetical protein